VGTKIETQNTLELTKCDKLETWSLRNDTNLVERAAYDKGGDSRLIIVHIADAGVLDVEASTGDITSTLERTML